LTDDELSKIQEILGADNEDYFTLDYFLGLWDDIFNCNGNCYTDYVSGKTFNDLFNYLRSIHVDIDNAISEGWAVKQEEVSHGC